MGIYESHHPSVVERFAFERLIVEPTWIEEHEDRLYEDVRVPSKPGDPYGVVTVREGDVALWAGESEYIGKITSILEVVSIRTYPTGKGSWFDFTKSYDALRRALTGVSCEEVFMPYEDANGVETIQKIGEVYMAHYLGKVKRVRSTGNFDVLHHGITVKVVHK